MVREAAQDSASVILRKLSGHGVKQVLTPVLTSLQDPGWKTRQEGAKVLAVVTRISQARFLVPHLSQLLTSLIDLASNDLHPRVKEAGRNALKEVSTSAVKNPEMIQLSPVVVEALIDPSTKARTALEAVLHCEFMHALDIPSLALLVPLLARGLRDRGAEVKKKAAAIASNLPQMVGGDLSGDPKSLGPLLCPLLPGLQEGLLDPIPEVRASCAKTLGSLAKGVGEEVAEMQSLVPW